jgi:RNAse (barnase) inhibitor barstar
MTPQEVADEYDRRLDEIWDLYEEAIKAPSEAARVAAEQRDEARKELNAWYAKNYDGTAEGEWAVEQ